jgi:hypothetical protein
MNTLLEGQRSLLLQFCRRNRVQRLELFAFRRDIHLSRVHDAVRDIAPGRKLLTAARSASEWGFSWVATAPAPKTVRFSAILCPGWAPFVQPLL